MRKEGVEGWRREAKGSQSLGAHSLRFGSRKREDGRKLVGR